MVFMNIIINLTFHNRYLILLLFELIREKLIFIFNDIHLKNF